MDARDRMNRVVFVLLVFVFSGSGPFAFAQTGKKSPAAALEAGFQQWFDTVSSCLTGAGNNETGDRSQRLQTCSCQRESALKPVLARLEQIYQQGPALQTRTVHVKQIARNARGVLSAESVEVGYDDFLVLRQGLKECSSAGQSDAAVVQKSKAVAAASPAPAPSASSVSVAAAKPESSAAAGNSSSSGGGKAPAEAAKPQAAVGSNEVVVDDKNQDALALQEIHKKLMGYLLDSRKAHEKDPEFGKLGQQEKFEKGICEHKAEVAKDHAAQEPIYKRNPDWMGKKLTIKRADGSSSMEAKSKDGQDPVAAALAKCK